MNTYEYLKSEFSASQLKTMAMEGILSPKIITYMEIYEYHQTNGRCRTKTASAFGIPSPTIGYALQRMKQPIKKR